MDSCEGEGDKRMVGVESEEGEAEREVVSGEIESEGVSEGESVSEGEGVSEGFLQRVMMSFVQMHWT